MEVLVGEEGEDEEGGFFNAEEDGGAGEHERFIRDWLGDGSLCSGRSDGDAEKSRSFDSAAPRSG